MAGARNFRCSLRRSRERLRQRSPRTSRGGAADRTYPFDRRQTARAWQGRAFLSHIDTELLPILAGRLIEGKAASAPALSLAELDAALMAFIVGTYGQRPHSQIDEAPHAAWRGAGWLPRMPDSLDALDLLLITVAKPRMVQRDGIHFQGLRYIDTTLAAFVGNPSPSVSIRATCPKSVSFTKTVFSVAPSAPNMPTAQ